jgi:RNA 2',3'-cyclic 3'-phosphodiesterase
VSHFRNATEGVPYTVRSSRCGTVPRLFVAIDLPDEIKRGLQRRQPADVRGIRCTTPDQMHLTLHFLGETELPSTIDALGNVVAEPFSLRMTGVGKFGAANRGVIL